MTEQVYDTFYDLSRLDMERLKPILGEVTECFDNFYLTYLHMLYNDNKIHTLSRGDQLILLVKFFGKAVKRRYHLFESTILGYSLDPLLMTILFSIGVYLPSKPKSLGFVRWKYQDKWDFPAPPKIP